MMKKLVIATVIFALMLALVACGGAAAPETATVDDATPEVASDDATLPDGETGEGIGSVTPAPTDPSEPVSPDVIAPENGATEPSGDATPAPAPTDDPGEPAPSAAPENSATEPSGDATEPEVTTNPVATTVSLRVTCAVLTANPDAIAEPDLIPDGGVMLSVSDAQWNDGDSVFDVLQRECRAAKLHLEFVNTPGYGTAYIEGIGNIYEFDGGALSGWTYSVNGEFPGTGSSKYVLQAGDKIEWMYTLDLGADVGNSAPLQG